MKTPEEQLEEKKKAIEEIELIQVSLFNQLQALEFKKQLIISTPIMKKEFQKGGPEIIHKKDYPNEPGIETSWDVDAKWEIKFKMPENIPSKFDYMNPKKPEE